MCFVFRELSTGCPHHKDTSSMETPNEKDQKLTLSSLPSLSWAQIAQKSFKTFYRAFVLAYGIRAGVSVVARALGLLRKNPWAIFNMTALLSEKKLIFRVEAAKLGMFFGLYSGVHEFVEAALSRLRGKYDGWNTFVAGSVAGGSIVFQEKDRRRTLALYMCTRLVQCVYNAAKARGMWHFWGSSWAHGDSLLFVLSSAQVMYAYVMRPETLPPDYWKFIVNTGPITKQCLHGVRNSCRGVPVDSAALMKHAAGLNKNALIPTITPDVAMVPCGVMHPQSQLCFRQNAPRVWADAFRRTFPLYASLNFVPYVVLNFKRFLKAPLNTLVHATGSAARSTSFLASFVAIYQMVICSHRALATRDTKFIYYIAGLFSSLSILIEKKARRSELALYVLPRAADSLFMILNDRKWLASIPHGEIYLFCVSMGGLMYFFRQETDTMAPFIQTIFSKFVSPLKTIEAKAEQESKATTST